MRSKILFLTALYTFALFAHTNTTVVSRLQLAHPDLGYDGGAALHNAVNNMYVRIGDNISSRYSEYTSIADSTTTTVEHNFGVVFTELRVLLYTGTGSTKVRVSSPAASGWTIVATPSFLTTKIDVTTPVSGGPHTFSVEILQESVKLADLTDIDFTTPAEDGQALVYNSTTSKWLPGASGDSSLKCQSITSPTLVLKSGFLIRGDGSELQVASDLSLNLSTILGTTPTDATAYYLYVDQDTLPAATTLANGRKVIVASSNSNFSLQTTTPDSVLLSRYLPLCVIKSATTGNAWSGSGSAFATLATRRHDRPSQSVSPIVYALTQQAVGTIGSSGQIAAGHVLTTASFPTFTTQVSFFNLAADALDGSGNARPLTNNGTTLFTATNILGATNSAATMNGTTQYFSTTNSFFNAGAADFTIGGWFNLTDWTPTAINTLFGYSASASDAGIEVLVNTNGTIELDYPTSATTYGSFSVVPSFVDGTWHHVAVKYTNSTKTWGLYIDGQLAMAQNSSVANRTITAPLLRVGASFYGGNPGRFVAGKIEDVFFSTLSLKDEDIRRLYSYRIDHNDNVPVANQQWDASFIGNLSNKLNSSWIVHLTANSIYWDFSDLASTDQVAPSMASKSLTSLTVPVKTFTTGKLTSSPTFPLAHGLGARPKDFYLLTTASSVSSADDKRYDLCSATDTHLNCDVSSLTIDASHQIEVVASAAPVALAVGDASLTQAGIVNTTTQSFAGAKTFSTGLVSSASTAISGAVTLSSLTGNLIYGTFTPTVSANTGTTLTPTLANAMYTRVGDIVMVQASFNLTKNATTVDFKFSLPSVIQPTNNWASNTAANGTVGEADDTQFTNGQCFTDSGSKLIRVIAKYSGSTGTTQTLSCIVQLNVNN